jgi:hypothetical protein
MPPNTIFFKKWRLRKRMQNYIDRNGKYSPMNRLEYVFLKELYWYLTKQQMSSDFKKQLYENYIKLINLGYFCNRSDLNLEMMEIIHLQCQLILEENYSGPMTFIMLNNNWHYEKMLQIIDLIYNWSINPQYYGYASEKEFFNDMDFLRKQFTENKVDIYSAVDKWPREFRKRFQRENRENKEK